MKYIKEYKEIDWDDWDDVEDDPMSNSFKVGDHVKSISGDSIKFWSVSKDYPTGRRYWIYVSGPKFGRITDIKHVNEIELIDNNDYNGYVMKIFDHWPWFQLDGFEIDNEK